MIEQDQSLDELIGQLRTPEGRAIAARRALELLGVRSKYLDGASNILGLMEELESDRRFTDLMGKELFGQGIGEFSKDSARKQLNVAEIAQKRGNTGSARYHFRMAIDYMMWARDYQAAYDLSIRLNFRIIARRVHDIEIGQLEKKGKFLSCRILEEERRYNAGKAKMYESLSKTLQIA